MDEEKECGIWDTQRRSLEFQTFSFIFSHLSKSKNVRNENKIYIYNLNSTKSNSAKLVNLWNQVENF